MTAILFLLLTIPLPPIDTVDLAEVNTFGGNGNCQVILWDWSYEHDCFIVIAWRMVKCDKDVHVLLTQVKYTSYRETWTLNDPEVDNREIVSENKRRKIRW